jgi:hypothetical protein
MSYDNYGKSYGGYSTHSLPTRNAEKKKSKKKKRKKDPKYVHEKYKEILKGQKSKDEGKAKAVAWSIYCKYKNPNSPRCKKDPDEYFSNRKAYEGRREMRSVARKVGKEMSQRVAKGILCVYDIVEGQASSKYVSDLAIYMWTRGEIPPYLLRYGKEAIILGEISNRIHKESKPHRTPSKEERMEAISLLAQAFEKIYMVWSIRTWSRLKNIMGNTSLTILKLELLSYDNRIQYSYEYEKLLSVMFLE